MPTAQNVEAFNPTALGERPPKTSVAHGATPAQSAQHTATGRPAGLIQTDGTAELRTKCQTFKAADSRPTSSKVGSAPSGVQTFNPGTV